MRISVFNDIFLSQEKDFFFIVFLKKKFLVKILNLRFLLKILQLAWNLLKWTVLPDFKYFFYSTGNLILLEIDQQMKI